MTKKLGRKDIPLFHFEKISVNRQSIDELESEPIIIELKNGLFFIANLDDTVENSIAVYDCKELMELEISHMSPYDKEKRWENMPESIFKYFNLDEIKSIYSPKDKELPLEEIMILALNPWYKPVKGMSCDWSDSGKHSEKCDEDLHESLAEIYKKGTEKIHSRKELDQYNTMFEKIRKFIIENKGQIP